jgi:hypothetical protein
MAATKMKGRQEFVFEGPDEIFAIEDDLFPLSHTTV